MASEFTAISKVRTASIIAGVCMFVIALLILPYNLTQISKENSSELQASLFIDESLSADLRETLALRQNEWEPTDTFNFGLDSRPHWLKAKLPTHSANENRLLLINYGLLDHVSVWFLTSPDNGSEVIGAYATGDAINYYERVINSEKFLFEVPESEDDIYVYVKARSKGPLNIPLEVWSTNDFLEYSNLQKLFLGVFFGYMIAMGLSNLYFYATTRNILFATYAGYVFSIALVMATLQGISFHYLWPKSTWLQEYAVPMFGSMTMIFIITLTTKLLKLRKQAPSIYNMLHNIRLVFFVLLFLSIVFPYYSVLIKLVLVLLVITTFIIFGAGLFLAIRGSVVARYFCGAWGVLLVSGTSISLESFGFFESPINSSYLMMVGAITEALILTLALAVSLNEQLAASKTARDLALKNEQEAIEAKDELIRLQEKNQSDLEYSIEERTLELEIALRELSEKNRELEKLSAIDPLTGLMNRRYFDKRIVAECRRSKRELSTLGFAMLDIDFFKKINDTFGHLAGDHCLKVFATILKETIKRPSDIVCRYGGEEFVLMLPNTDKDGLVNVLEKVRIAVEAKRILFEGQEISMTVSIGACSRIVLSEDETSLIIAFADKLLYQAKASGRNIVMVDSF